MRNTVTTDTKIIGCGIYNNTILKDIKSGFKMDRELEKKQKFLKIQDKSHNNLIKNSLDRFKTKLDRAKERISEVGDHLEVPWTKKKNTTEVKIKFNVCLIEALKKEEQESEDKIVEKIMIKNLL